jgi:hypothetical protein
VTCQPVDDRCAWCGASAGGFCTDADCDAKSFMEQTPAIEGSLTRRAAKEICRRVGENGHAVGQVAREFGVGWATAMACVRRHGEPLVDDPGRTGVTEALGIDEHKVLSATKDHHTLFATSFVDIVTGQLLDVVRGRNADDVAYWLTQGPPAWHQQIEAVAIDPHADYLRGISDVLPDVTVTVDHFHAIKLANAAVDDLRRRSQRSTLGHRGHRDDPLYRTQRLMTRIWEHLSERQREKLLAALAEGNPDGETGATILGKELLREVYAAPNLKQARWQRQPSTRSWHSMCSPNSSTARRGCHPRRTDLRRSTRTRTESTSPTTHHLAASLSNRHRTTRSLHSVYLPVHTYPRKNVQVRGGPECLRHDGTDPA